MYAHFRVLPMLLQHQQFDVEQILVGRIFSFFSLIISFVSFTCVRLRSGTIAEGERTCCAKHGMIVRHPYLHMKSM